MKPALSILCATLSLAILPAAARGETITTIPTAGGVFLSSGPNIGQTFTVLTESVLTSFAFQLDNTENLILTLHPLDDPFTILFISGALQYPSVFASTPVSPSMVEGSSGYLFDTGQLSLIPGGAYLAILSGASDYSGPFNLLLTDYLGGAAVSGDFYGGFPQVGNLAGDFAFRATFVSNAVPEPASLTLALTGIGALAVRGFRRRLRRSKSSDSLDFASRTPNTFEV